MISLQVCDVMQFFAHFETRRFTTVRDMSHALQACGIAFTLGPDIPDFGLVLIQIDGPWSHLPHARRWSDKYTHWVAVRDEEIYDVNGNECMPVSRWKESVLPLLIGATPRATGWSVKRSVRVPEQQFFAEAVVPGLRFR
jgi:hypothetical protein